MLSSHDLADIRVVLEAQRDVVRLLDAQTTALGAAFAENGHHADALVGLQQLMTQIEAQADLLEPNEILRLL